MPRMASTPSRVLWKGGINFGLVHIPVALHSATSEHAIDFDWLDKRTLDPVGYKRVNKKTGKEIPKEQIVKGVAVEGHDRYVVLSDEEIKAAYPRQSQSIEIESFVGAEEIPFVFLDRPYYLEPLPRGEKVYALLRETLLQTRRVGVARVVIQTKQHLAALVAVGPGLVLNLLRWGEDVRPWSNLKLPPEGSKAAGLKDSELKMAAQLVDDMTRPFKPEEFADSFQKSVMALVHRKAEAGEAHEVTQPEALESDLKSADVIDLAALLKQSLGRGTDKGLAHAAEAKGRRTHAAKRRA